MRWGKKIVLSFPELNIIILYSSINSMKILLFLFVLSIFANEDLAENDEIVYEKVFADVRGPEISPKSDTMID